jgi:hypothetical protein
VTVDNHSTRQYNPEDSSEHHTRRRENVKSHIIDPVTGYLKMSSVFKHMKVRLSIVCSLAEQMLSGWLVLTRHSSRNLAHARISNS